MKSWSSSSSSSDHKYFHRVNNYLTRFSWICDFKWTHLFVEKTAQKIPDDWAHFLSGLSVESLKRLLSHDVDLVGMPFTLREFVDESRSLSLRLDWPLFGPQEISDQMKNRRMSPKKAAEVDSFVKFILDFCQNSLKESVGSVTILDIGSGLGYISHNLSERGFRVIGVEANAGCCQRANIDVSSRGGDVHFIELKVNQSDECLEKIKRALPEQGPVLMIGLHCCGELLAHMVHLFNRLPQIKGMLSIACCYHQIDLNVFPRSDAFKHVLNEEPGFSFTVVNMRVAVQETPLTWSQDLDTNKLEAYAKAATHRGILEQVLQENGLNWKKPKRRVKLTASFDQYLDSIIFGFEESSRSKALHEMNNCFQLHSQEMHLVPLLKVLQTLVQPVIESLIVQDYVVKLKELGFRSVAVQCFSQLVSPRNLMLVSLK